MRPTGFAGPRRLEALASLPDGSRGEVADLTDSASVGALFGRIGAFDHLVYTAGEPLSLMPLDGLDVDAARSLFTLRCFGALGAVSAAVPHLRAGGSVTLAGGTAGLRPGPGWTVAAGICGAVDSMVRAMAVELAPLRVNAVRPGVVRSGLWSQLGEADRERMYEQVASGVPLGRIAEVQDIAEAFVYLIAQRFTTGTILTVDGGTLLA